MICSSGLWRLRVEHKLVPWGVDGVELGDRVLEVGPGFGATTRLLAARLGHLDVLELEPRYCERLRRMLGERVSVVQGDATQMPFESERFSAVVCFTMLHHLPSAEAQDRLLREAARVLEPEGVFAGSDSVGTGAFFKLLHVGDTLVPVGADRLAARLEHAGLREARVERADGSFRFRARKPARAEAL